MTQGRVMTLNQSHIFKVKVRSQWAHKVYPCLGLKHTLLSNVVILCMSNSGILDLVVYKQQTTKKKTVMLLETSPILASLAFSKFHSIELDLSRLAAWHCSLSFCEQVNHRYTLFLLASIFKTVSCYLLEILSKMQTDVLACARRSSQSDDDSDSDIKG